MNNGDKIILKVPGLENRFGTYCEDLNFDNMCKVQLTEFEYKSRRKRYKAPHWYLAHKEHVTYQEE